MISIAWHELISWGVALVSLTLFLVERRKNDNTKYYMLLQGVLRACYARAGFFAGQYGKSSRDPDAAVPRDLYLYVSESVYTDYKAMMAQIMGTMKALNPDKEMPFDVMQFLENQQEPEEPVN